MIREFKTPLFQVTEKLPRPGKWVFVITESYRCMGYLDDKGTWRSIHRGQVLEGVKAWSAAIEEETSIFNKKVTATMTELTMRLSLNDIRHLDAAESWLDRRDYFNCFHELERIDYNSRNDIRVLALRWRLYDRAGLHVSAAGIALEIQRRFPHEHAGYVWRALSLNKLRSHVGGKGTGAILAEDQPAARPPIPS